VTDSPAVVTVADLADLLDDPEWAEAPVSDGVSPLTPVLLSDAQDWDRLSRLHRVTPWRVLMGVCEGPAEAAVPEILDLGVCEGSEAEGWVAVESLEKGMDQLDEVAAANPVASAVLTQVTRINQSLGLHNALLAESAAYSSLLAGSEFHAWRDSRPPRPHGQDGAPLAIDWSDRTVVVRLNRPEVRNAYDPAMRDALTDALRAVAALPERPAVRLEGAGPDFCSGGDLSWFGTAEDVALAHAVRTTRSPGALLAELGASARVHGACVGAGTELPAFCPHLEADQTAWFRLPEVAMGLIPGAGGTVSVLARIGRHRLNWFGLSGRRIDASRAYGWGLVDTLV
jgi:hypothetical protein